MWDHWAAGPLGCGNIVLTQFEDTLLVVDVLCYQIITFLNCSHSNKVDYVEVLVAFYRLLCLTLMQGVMMYDIHVMV
jgi:hypothetical protein